MTALHLYAGNLYGGIERVLVALAKFAPSCPGMTPAFALCFRGRLWDELTAAGATVFDLGPVRFARPWTVLRARRRLGEVIVKLRPPVAVTHACWPHAVFAPAVRAAGARLAAWAHDTLTGRHWLERWARRTPPDVVVANSLHTAGTVGRVFPGVPCEVVHAPMDLAAPPVVPGMRAALNTPDTDTVILQASRLEEWKGAAVHVEALGRLKDVPGWTAWFAGGPQKTSEHEFFARLKSRAAALGITERVRFLGQRSDVPALLSAADIVCQPNTGPEPFGVAFVEALAAGKPVVTSGFGGGSEVVTPACGVLTLPPGDAVAVAVALRGLIRDPGMRQFLGSRGPARAAELCDPARQLARLARVLAGGAS